MCKRSNFTKLGDGVYEIGNSQVFVEGEKAVLLESNTLAGSVMSLNKAVKNVSKWCELSVPEVVKMVTLNPARILGLEKRMGTSSDCLDYISLIFIRTL